MSKELVKIFENTEFGQIRTINVDDEPWFVVKDICDILQHSNSRQAVKDLVDESDVSKAYIGLNTGLGEQKVNVNIVNESGLYDLIFGSKLPNAKKFKRWVTSEVLPSIRKHGMYAKDELLDNPDLLLDVVTKLKQERDLRILAEKEKEIINNQLEEAKPKIESFDTFISSDGVQTVANVAKSLGLGRNGLFMILRQQKLLMQNNVPYQQYIDSGYFVVKQKTINLGDHAILKQQTFVTAKGVDYISKKLRIDCEY